MSQLMQGKRVIRVAIMLAAVATLSIEPSAQNETKAKSTASPFVHPDLRSAAAELAKGRFPIRQAPAPLAPEWVRRAVPGPAGAPDVDLYIVNSRPSGPPRPLVVHMHGGGYIQGSARQSIAALQSLAAELDCVVVSVDYRLAPKTTFPGSLEDNYAALRWLHQHAGELGVDPSRIALLGESAGGGHAAMLAVAARDRGQVPIIFQALIYPMLDDRTGITHDISANVSTLVWTVDTNRQGWTALLGQAAGSASAPVGAVPARERSLEGLPPTSIGVGSIDLLLEESLAYAKRLADAAVPVELRVVPGAFHGFDIIVPEAPVSKQFHASVVAALRDAFRGKLTTP